LQVKGLPGRLLRKEKTMSETKTELDVRDIEIGLLDPNPENPNVMDDREFNALAEGIKTNGMIQPVNVVPKEDGRFEIVQGEWRWRACKAIGKEKIPCVVMNPEDWDADKKRIHTVRMNVLHGKIDPDKFLKMYNELKKRYNDEDLKIAFAMPADEFKRVYKEVKSSLPADLQSQLESTKKELKTIDDLANVLNSLFTEYGSTLEHGWMLFTFGGQVHYWIKLTKELKNRMKEITAYVQKEKLDMPTVIEQALKYWEDEHK
jgi:hypothetical protein